MNIQNSQEKDISLIPIGSYCYMFDHLYNGPKLKKGEMPIVNCPYSKYLEYKNTGVNLPYCAFLEEYGWDNNMTDDDFIKLKKHFGSDDKVFDAFPMDLLWDGCKECGERYEKDLGLDYDNEKDKIKLQKLNEEWILKIKNEKIS